MKQPAILITVSWIKNVYLRRLALVCTLPFVLIVAAGQGAILAALVMIVEPFRRAIEVGFVLRGIAPSFKEQWSRKAGASDQGESNE